jgi:hypothetical protein
VGGVGDVGEFGVRGEGGVVVGGGLMVKWWVAFRPTSETMTPKRAR